MFDRELSRDVNIGPKERWVSLVVGVAILVYGFIRSFKGLVAALIGGFLFYRGLSGHCYLYELLGRKSNREGTAEWAWSGGPGVRVEETVTINRPREEVYRQWRDLANLPNFMRHVVSVTPMGERRSHWVVKAPFPLQLTAEWDAEIVEERENELITWRSVPGASVDNAGSVHFSDDPQGAGTQVRILLAYSPPGGAAGTAFARLFNPMMEQQIHEDLLGFKHILEGSNLVRPSGGHSVVG